MFFLNPKERQCEYLITHRKKEDGKNLLFGVIGDREGEFDGVALFLFGIHLFGNDGEDDGEAVTGGDGEGLLVVGAVEHVVADGIEGVVELH